jgi:hypothetical protein
LLDPPPRDDELLDEDPRDDELLDDEPRDDDVLLAPETAMASLLCKREYRAVDRGALNDSFRQTKRIVDAALLRNPPLCHRRTKE